MLCFAVVVVWWSSLFVELPLWVKVLVVGIPAFVLAGDVINIIYIWRKLRPRGGG